MDFYRLSQGLGQISRSCLAKTKKQKKKNGLHTFLEIGNNCKRFNVYHAAITWDSYR